MSEKKVEGYVEPTVAEDVVRTMSPNKFGMWTRCQYQFFQRYVLGLKRPPSGPIAFGKATDELSAAFFEEKKATHEDWDESLTKEFWADRWATVSKEVEDWESDDPNTMLDQGVEAAKVWRSDIGVNFQPHETKFYFELPIYDWILNGEIDTIGKPSNEEHLPVIATDTKTTKRAWRLKKVLEEDQPVAYSLALQHTPKLEARIDTFQYHVLIRKNTKTRGPEAVSQIINRPVDQEERDGFVIRLEMARTQIMDSFRSGVFLPNRKHTLCTRRFCGFWHDCEKAFGGTIPE